WSCSLAVPPKTIAPKRPFPIGSASVHSTAGLSYHKRRSSSSGDVAAFEIEEANGNAAAVRAELARKFRRVIFCIKNSYAKAQKRNENAKRGLKPGRLCAFAPLRENFCLLARESLHLDRPLHFSSLRILSQCKITTTRYKGDSLQIAVGPREESVYLTAIGTENTQLHVVPVHILRALRHLDVRQHGMIFH